MIPKVESDGAVIEATAERDHAAAKLAELRAEKHKLAERFRINPDAGAAAMRRRIEEAHTACVSSESRGACKRLAKLIEHEPDLIDQNEAAEKRVDAARASATKRLAPWAWEAVAEVNRKKAVAFLALLAVCREESAVRAAIQAAKLPDPPVILAQSFLRLDTSGANDRVTELVRDGLLSRDEVKAALPDLEAY